MFNFNTIIKLGFPSDVNNDGYLDLLLTTTTMPLARVFLAFGCADGTLTYDGNYYGSAGPGDENICSELADIDDDGLLVFSCLFLLLSALRSSLF